MASARTAVGRVVNALDSVRIARDKMGIPIDGEATGKVNQLDERDLFNSDCWWATKNN